MRHGAINPVKFVVLSLAGWCGKSGWHRAMQSAPSSDTQLSMNVVLGTLPFGELLATIDNGGIPRQHASRLNVVQSHVDPEGVVRDIMDTPGYQGPLPVSIVHTEDVPLAGRGGHAIPGYSGHVPGKGPEGANMGKRFAAANEHGFRSLRGEPSQAQASNHRKCRDPHGNIPGYSGHIPGKLEDSFGATWHSVNLRLASADSKVPMSTPRAEVRPGEWARSERRPLAPEAAEGSAMLRPGTGQAASAVPGYSGHVPGKLSENIVGARCAAANAIAATAEPGTIKWQRTAAPGVSMALAVRMVKDFLPRLRARSREKQVSCAFFPVPAATLVTGDLVLLYERLVKLIYGEIVIFSTAPRLQTSGGGLDEMTTKYTEHGDILQHLQEANREVQVRLERLETSGGAPASIAESAAAPSTDGGFLCSASGDNTPSCP
ncbi:hypothetical protein AK812_SmicGene26855 [Symbiodinium microadriaticum]|uniref:Uncharacterized protein n=1 Tax=Symbiodinium microadriaticum TaxID=2951 RepID=A0A1Q9D8A9_SYMMI|nr:hypothetical protein AK812_SmicGene26855 [Symbiodinium microadriaticum]